MRDTLNLSAAELQRAEILQACLARRMKNRQAAAKLGVTVRQLQRLKRAFKQRGLQALASKKRGRPSHNRLPTETTGRVRELLHARYADFGPTLAHEKLVEVHHLHLSCETVRQLMITEGLWKPHRAKRAMIHPLRDPSTALRTARNAANWCRSMAPPSTGLKVAPRRVPCWSSLTMPLANS